MNPKPPLRWYCTKSALFFKKTFELIFFTQFDQTDNKKWEEIKKSKKTAKTSP